MEEFSLASKSNSHKNAFIHIKTYSQYESYKCLYDRPKIINKGGYYLLLVSLDLDYKRVVQVCIILLSVYFIPVTGRG